MTNFVYDSFTAADATAVDARAGETGATWTKHTSYASGGSAIFTNALEGTTYNDSIYWASGAPAGAEYDVSASWKVMIVSSDYGGGIIGRVDTTVGTFYLAEHYAGTWYLAKIVAGSRTGLGTYAQTLVNGTTYALKLEIRDAAKKLFVDGVERISSSDNTITAAGKAGVKLYQGSSAHANALLDFTATDATSTDTTAPVLTSPTGTATGSTTASGTISTDTAEGTLYFLASTNATETAATVKAASSQSVTATGSQSVSFTGLTASTTYYAHYCHRDVAGNDSTVANSTSFTTSAGASAHTPAYFQRLIAGR